MHTVQKKKVLVISTSLRKNSNSDRMACAFAQGAREAGCEVTEISLKENHLQYCIGCMSCMKTNRCVLKDDGNALKELVRGAQVLAFATPVYYYEMSGQMKTFLDRMNPIYTDDYAFREVYLLTCAAESEEAVPKRAETGLNGWIACFDQARYAGMVFAGGVSAPGEIEGHPALQQAFDAGRACRGEDTADQNYYIVVTEGSSAYNGSCITGITGIGKTAPDSTQALEQLLIEYAQEDGCGEMDWHPAALSFGTGGITADASMEDLTITMTYLLCGEQDLEAIGVTFGALEERFRAACAGAGLEADFQAEGPFAFRSTSSENGRIFVQLRDTDPITYGDMIRYLVQCDLNRGTGSSGYDQQLQTFLGEFTRLIRQMQKIS